MKEGQSAIYYLTASKFATARSSPQLEAFRKRGVEVLLLADRVDEWLVMHLSEFEGKPLQSAAKGALDLAKIGDETGTATQQERAEAMAPTIARVKDALGDRVQDVRLSARAPGAPSRLGW